MIKQAVRKVVHALGYDLVNFPKSAQADLTAYHELCSAEMLAQKPFYNVGAGAFRHPYWTNVDKPSDWYREHQDQQAMIAYDLMERVPLPIADDEAQLIYTSHTMEHVPDVAAFHFFSEAHRTLAPDGLLRVTVPDADLFYRAYCNRDRHFDNIVRQYADPVKAHKIGLDVPADAMSPQQLFLWRVATTVSVHHTDGSPERLDDDEVDRLFDTLPYEEALNECIAKCDLEVQRRHPGCHVNWWNWKKLSQSLREAGFSKVRRCGFGQSASPLMRDKRFFDSTRPESSIYVEAEK